jgi:hypothetical protein
MHQKLMSSCSRMVMQPLVEQWPQPVRRAKCERWPDEGVSGAATQMEPIVGGRRDRVVVGRATAPAWR